VGRCRLTRNTVELRMTEGKAGVAAHAGRAFELEFPLRIA